MILLAALLLGRDTGGMTREERRLADTLSSIQGAGRVRVTLYYGQSGGALSGSAQKVTGALAVASGAGSVGVRLRLTEALETLLSLPPGSVLVLEMEE
ncbi:MAG: hypothetical protein IJ214_03075 [Clostridia bacterium]|nr:hypothetical protein [Clostridia bacterium]